MKNRIAIITGGDSKYYHLICEQIASIRRFPQSSSVDLHVMDAGLQESEVARLKAQNIGVFKPDWPNEKIAKKGARKPYVKACILRPFLRDLVPGYDIYIWFDGDTWLQNWETIELYIKGAERMAVTCASTVHHARPRSMRISWLGPFPFKPKSFYYSNARRAFGGKVARQLFPYNVLLAGGFSLHRDAPHWNRWQELIMKAMQKGKLFTAEQLTLGILVYLENFAVEILPLYCNWIAGYGICWDPEKKIFTEPYLPHQPIGLMHLAGVSDIRSDAEATMEVKGLDGVMRQMSLRFGPQYAPEAAETLRQLKAA